MSLWGLLNKHCRGERQAKTTIRKQSEQRISGGLLRLITQLQSRLRPKEGTPVDLLDIINQLLNDLQFEKYLEETHGPEYESRWANVQEFANLVAEFVHHDKPEDEILPILDNTQPKPDDDALARFLANVALASDKQTDDKSKEEKSQVTLSTIHAAKGLEWPVVFVPAVYKGSIPHIRSDDDSEERRLLYVAMTRAQALLYLSCPKYTSSGGKEAVCISPFIEKLSSSNFLKKGPSLDRPVMSEIARILGRDLPSENAIYKDMPMMAAMEDNRFPIDPNQAEADSSSVINSYSSYNQHPGPHKRQKLHHLDPQTADKSINEWATPPSTTMQRSASFTVPHPSPQPGFTTAGAHYANATAAEAARDVTTPHRAAGTKRPPPNRAPSQRSLIGYGYGVTNHDKSKQIDDVTPLIPSNLTRSVSYTPRPYNLAQGNGREAESRQLLPSGNDTLQAQQRPAVKPEFGDHKLGSAKFSTRPATTRQAVEKKPPPPPQSKQYACFSSSPTKIKPEEEEEEAEKENEVPLEEQVRPAKSFHATTVDCGPKVGWRGGGGIRRPASLGRSSITPMDRLKRPFKPLTVKRER